MKGFLICCAMALVSSQAEAQKRYVDQSNFWCSEVVCSAEQALMLADVCNRIIEILDAGGYNSVRNAQECVFMGATPGHFRIAGARDLYSMSAIPVKDGFSVRLLERGNGRLMSVFSLCLFIDHLGNLSARDRCEAFN